MTKLLIRDLPDGIIIWHGKNIIGVKGLTLNEKYYDRYCRKFGSNPYDYELLLGERKNGRE